MWNFYTPEAGIRYNYFLTAHEWFLRLPGFLRSYSDFNDNFDYFADNLAAGMIFIGTIDGVFSGMVYGEHKDEKTVEGHLFCKKHADIDFVSALVTYSKRSALEKYEKVITHVLDKHKVLHCVMARSGFVDTGIRSFPSTYNGEFLESKFYVASR